MVVIISKYELVVNKKSDNGKNDSGKQKITIWVHRVIERLQKPLNKTH